MYRRRLLSILITGLAYFNPSYGMLNQMEALLPLTIEAGIAEFNYPNKTSSYTDHVMVNQGTTHITGHKITTKQDKTNALEEIIIYGTSEQLAYYETIPDPDKPKLIATAVTIKYYPQKRYVILIKQAKIIQGDNSISGEHIEYDLINQRMRTVAITNEDGEKARTTIVINPDKKKLL